MSKSIRISDSAYVLLGRRADAERRTVLAVVDLLLGVGASEGGSDAGSLDRRTAEGRRRAGRAVRAGSATTIGRPGQEVDGPASEDRRGGSLSSSAGLAVAPSEGQRAPRTRPTAGTPVGPSADRASDGGRASEGSDVDRRPALDPVFPIREGSARSPDPLSPACARRGCGHSKRLHLAGRCGFASGCVCPGFVAPAEEVF